MTPYVYPDPGISRRAAAVRAIVGQDPRYFTLVANLTTLSHRCRFAAGAGGSLAARYLDLPFAAASFYGAGPDLEHALRGLLRDDEACYALVADEQLAQLRSAAELLDVESEWQMVFREDPAALDPGDAVRLGSADWTAMCQLAQRGEMFAFEPNALEKGPYFGVWRDGRLAAMAGTHLLLDKMVEIGNIVTDPDRRRRGLATMAVSALVQALCARDRMVFLQVFKSNRAAIALYEKLGFRPERTMYLVRFRLVPAQG